MKKIVMVILAILFAAQILSAVPAMPGKFTRTLPDGRKVTLQLHGDEFQHYLTDESGRVVRLDSRGFLVPSSRSEAPVFMGGAEAVNAMRLQRVEKTRQLTRRGAPARSRGVTLHFPLVLVQFPDLPFTVAETDDLVREAFNNLVNQEGYSANGGTGSINDFYRDNTMGLLDICFDVFGPVTVSESYAYYGSAHDQVNGSGTSEAASQALFEALQIVAGEQGEDVFNPYDNDGDGRVDAVFMYYAGHNEAEGAGEETIWPHEWTLGSYDYYFGTDYSKTQFGNVSFNTYSCSSELRGREGTDMCGIGTAVHEFGHALGLPDLYDTNYDKIGDGQCGGMYNFTPMCNGSYLNNSRTPSYFTMEERIMMGWAGDYEPMPAFGGITIPSVDTNFAYREETGNPGEYFVFECRKGAGWDTYLPAGLVVYHVDRSANPVFIYSGPGVGNWSTAADIWTSNSSKINCNLEHPCCYVIPASDQQNRCFSGYHSAIPFPGSASVTTYQWQGWDPDNRQADLFYDIAFNQGAGTVTLRRDGVDTSVRGKITDTAGNPVSGATVSVYAGSDFGGMTLRVPSAGGPNRIARHTGEPVRTVASDKDGNYLVNLEGTGLTGIVSVEVSAPGCVTKVEQVALTQRAVVTGNFTLLGLEEPTHTTLSKFGEDAQFRTFGFGESYGIQTYEAAVKYTAEELAAFAGRKISGLNFLYHLGSGKTLSGVKGVIDFGSQRRLVDVPAPVADSWNYLDVSALDLQVPLDTDCCFGYALEACSEGWPFYNCPNEEPTSGGMMMYFAYSTGDLAIPEEVRWWDYSSYGPVAISVVLEDGSVLPSGYIGVSRSYGVGDTLDLGPVSLGGDVAPGTEISWFLDDEPVSGPISLGKAGKHTLEARFTTPAGRRKVVEMEITVE